MSKPGMRALITFTLFLMLLCTGGWLLPDHFCRQDACMECIPVDDCCAMDTRAGTDVHEEKSCCYDVNGYFNIPLFFSYAQLTGFEIPSAAVEWRPVLSVAPVSDFPLCTTEAKPPDLFGLQPVLLSVIGVFRI